MNVEMKLNVKVDTYVNGNLIVQDVSSVVDDKISQLSRQVYDTSEKGFRDALAKIGWMPPDVVAEVKDVLLNVKNYLVFSDYEGSWTRELDTMRGGIPMDVCIELVLEKLEEQR